MMNGKRILISAAAALLAAAGSLFALAADDLSFEMVEGEWIALHVWLPSDAVAAILPAPLKPGRFRLDPLESEPPGTMVDAYVILRRGTFRLPLAGKTVDESDVLDMMLLVAVQTPEALQHKEVSDFYLLEYATSNQLLTTLLHNNGIEARNLEGSHDSRTMPSMQQEAHAVVTLAGHEPWDILARSTGSIHFDLGNRTWLIFFDKELRTLTISLRDDFYMRASSRISGFHENNPIAGFEDWRWADSDTLLLFTTGSTHKITDSSTMNTP